MPHASGAQIWIDDRSVAVALSGHLADATARVLGTELPADADLVIVDLTAVTSIDGEGLDQLIELAEWAVAGGAQVRYCNAIRNGAPIELPNT